MKGPFKINYICNEISYMVHINHRFNEPSHSEDTPTDVTVTASPDSHKRCSHPHRLPIVHDDMVDCCVLVVTSMVNVLFINQ